MMRGVVASLALGGILGCAAMRATPQQERVMDAFAACKADLGIQLGDLTYVSPDGRRVEYWSHVADKNAALMDCMQRRLAGSLDAPVPVHPK